MPLGLGFRVWGQGFRNVAASMPLLHSFAHLGTKLVSLHLFPGFLNEVQRFLVEFSKRGQGGIAA